MENKDNYRPNVAIIIANKAGKVLWCKRKDGYGWQFPQGGLDNGCLLYTSPSPRDRG